MPRIKRNIYFGCVCEQIVYTAHDKRGLKHEKKPRFANAEERQKYNFAQAKRNHVRIINENFTSESLYTTLTFDESHEIHCPARSLEGKYPKYDEAVQYAYKQLKKVRDNYIRRLKRKYPDAVIAVYMGRGKDTDRMHLHMISNGIPEEYLIKQWQCGYICRCENLREHNYYGPQNNIDYGEDFTGLANYLFDHWEWQQGSHRYKITKNARKPERETATICIRNYTVEKPPRAPKGYKLVEAKENDYGFLYFKYVIDTGLIDKDINYRRKKKKLE